MGAGNVIDPRVRMQQQQDAAAALQAKQDAATYAATQAAQQRINGGVPINSPGTLSGYGSTGGGGSFSSGSSGSGGSGGGGGDMYVRDPSGRLITQSAYEAEQMAQQSSASKLTQMQEAARLQADAEARRLASFSSFINTQPNVHRSTMAPDETAARNAAFGQAKDKAGQTALASLKAMQDVMAGNGMTGSSVEGQGVADVVSNAANGINNFGREQLTSDLDREKQIQDQDYQAQITQRGQTLSALPSILGMITASSGLSY